MRFQKPHAYATFQRKVGVNPNIARLGGVAFWVLACGCYQKNSHMPQDDLKEYSFSVNTNDVRVAIAQTGSIFYDLLEEALQAHEDHEAEECDFELFARDILAVLARHADQLAELEGSLADDPDLPPDELVG